MDRDVTRRQFLRMGGSAALTAAGVAAVPDLLRFMGHLNPALAQEADITLDTFNGLAAFLWPGDDAYSVAQGESSDRPGAVAANAGFHIAAALDFFVPAPDDVVSNDLTVPLSQAIAGGLNTAALATNPLAVGGTFLSPFSRLSYADKAAAYGVLETDTQQLNAITLPEPLDEAQGVLQFVFGVLPGFVQFFAFSEIDVFDAGSKTLKSRPIGWDHTGFQDDRLVPVEGWDEFIGFLGGRTAINGSDGTGLTIDPTRSAEVRPNGGG